MTAAVTGFGLSTVQVDTTRHLSPWQHLEEGQQQQQQGLLQEKILVVAAEKAARLTVVGQPMVQQGLQVQQSLQVQQQV